MLGTSQFWVGAFEYRWKFWVDSYLVYGLVFCWLDLLLEVQLSTQGMHAKNYILGNPTYMHGKKIMTIKYWGWQMH